MVADSERRDGEICVKLVMPFRGLRGFISGQSHSHPHPMPWDSRGESAVNTLHTHTHTHTAFAAGIMCETLRYRAEHEKAHRLLQRHI